MSQLVLIRHGQADSFSADGDRLTALGQRQAQLLGEHLVANQARFDEVVIGSMRRHAQTEAEVAAAYQRAGMPWPQARVVPGWNEYDAASVMGTLGQTLAAQDPSFRKLVEDFQVAAGGPERNRYFQRMFEVLMARWVQGGVQADGVETYDAFHGRVSASLEDVLTAQASRRVAVFTSGGPIGVCVQRTLRSPKEVALEVNWRVRNSSLTEFVYGKGRISFDLFNVTPHLGGPALISYR